ncbi:MAG: hypothetical protein HDT27_10305 [Subdoligranulum sp.]|nr:hypothetical protein [Subdoligranulum sp.]
MGKDAPGRLSRAPSAASHHPAALCAQSKRAIRSHRCIFHVHDIVNYYIHPAAVCQIFFENCIANVPNTLKFRQNSGETAGLTRTAALARASLAPPESSCKKLNLYKNPAENFGRAAGVPPQYRNDADTVFKMGIVGHSYEHIFQWFTTY